MEELDLSAIRAVFPNWPSELEVARVPGNWASMAQAFHCAAHVLAEEQRKGHQRMHANAGQPLDIDAFRRCQTSPAAIFCLAFSLELAIKAARVHQGALSNLQSGDCLPFQTHNLDVIASKLDGLDLSAEDIDCLKECSAIVSAGKYPVGVSPDGSANGVRPQMSFDDLARIAVTLYGRLSDLVTQKPDAAE